MTKRDELFTKMGKERMIRFEKVDDEQENGEDMLAHDGGKDEGKCIERLLTRQKRFNRLKMVER